MTIQYQGVWSLQSAAQLQSTQRWVTDPLFENTTLLLQADDAANGAQNNTFLDSSSNAFAITRNGNTTQGSFTPFSLQPGAWGNYFGGSDALTIPSTAALTFGTGDFCVEFWLYRTGTSTCGLFSNSTGAGGGDAQFEIQLQTTTTYVSLLGWNTVFMTGVTPINTNTWYHIAVVRSGTSMAMFVNGKRDATATSANNFSSANGFNIGRQATGAGNLTGYISNLRAVKGSSVYSPASTSIVIPLDPLTAITNTSLLTCQSNRFIDNSTNAFAVTTVGTTSVQPFSPFAPQFQWTPSVIGGSGYFDGSGDYLLTGTAATSLGTNNFTMECWVRPNSSGDYIVFDCRGGSNINRPTLGVVSSQLAYQTSGINRILAGTVPINAWSHLAVVRNSNVVLAYINGAQVGTYSDSSDYGTVTRYSIGADDDGSPNAFFPGYVSSARFVTAAVYTGAFTPPSAPLSTSGAGSASAYPSTTNVNTSFAASATSLFLNFTNAGIYDGTMKNNLETLGNAQISTAVVKYGSGSMYFDGTGDQLVMPASENFEFGSGNFTVECWVYISGTSGSIINYSNGQTANSNFCWEIYQSSSTVVQITIVEGSTVYSASSSSFSLNVWNHVAAVRNGNTLTIYVNGTAGGTTANVTGVSISRRSGVTVKVSGYNNATGMITGYIDDLRITKGIARYTQNFIPPSVALPRQ